MESKFKSDQALKSRLALVSEIDKSEFAWKKKKKEMQHEMGRFLNIHTTYQDKVKSLHNEILKLEQDVKQAKLSEFTKRLDLEMK